MNTNLYIGFLQKISRIFLALENKNSQEETVKNLTAALILNLSKLLAMDDKIAPLLTELGQTQSNDSSKLFEFLDSKGVDYKVHFETAEKETLQNFIAELTPNLSPEKVEELNKIIS